MSRRLIWAAAAPPYPCCGGRLSPVMTLRGPLLALLAVLALQTQRTITADDLAITTKGLQEYCQLETFVATCDVTEVIIMETAYYGRMRLGRCVKGDLGYIGCSADVLDIADRKCSGRHRCEIPIPNEDFERTRPCYRELKSHLEASYACVKVASLEGSICQSCDSIKVTKLTGYIASIVSQNTGCGTSGCPWIIEASKGQRINITLFDFTRPAKEDTSAVGSLSAGCQHMTEYIFIKEDTRNHPISLCSGTKRIRHIYLSASHKVELMMTSDMGSQEQGHFILRHEVIGCADMEVGPTMTFQRETDYDASVTCLSTSQSWHITCVERSWVGEIGNCTLGGGTNQESARIAIGGLNVAYGTAIIIIVFVAVLVGILILLIGLIGWKWYGKSCFRVRRRKKNKRSRATGDKVSYEEEPAEGYETYVTRCPVDLYAHAWEVTRPILDRDMTLISDDMHKAHMMATYCTKDCQNTCTFKGCRKHPPDTYATTTYNRPEPIQETSTTDNIRYYEQEPQL